MKTTPEICGKFEVWGAVEKRQGAAFLRNDELQALRPDGDVHCIYFSGYLSIILQGSAVPAVYSGFGAL